MTRRDFIQWAVRSFAAAALIDAFWFEKAWFEWKEFVLHKSANASTQLAFMQISDLHLNALDDVLREAAHKINGIKPDFICLTGDAIDRKEHLSLLDEFLKLLDASIPKFAILGNWEYWGNVDLKALKAVYETHNCRLLVNQSFAHACRGKTVLITGFDDLIGGTLDPNRALADYCPNDYHIVLNHCPKFRDTMLKKSSEWPLIDLVLAGHTHGGQINLFGFIPVLPPGSGHYVKGWYKEAQPPMYVSRGIGTSGVPVRFGSRAEIATFRVNL